MKFIIRQNAYINLPFHMEGDPVGLIRTVPQLVAASASQPRELDLADDHSLDSISLSWEPVDEKAKQAQAKLRALKAQRRADAVAAAKAGDAVEAAPAKVTAADLLDALASLPKAEREALLAAAADKDRKAQADAAASETMSGQTTKIAAQRQPKG